MQIKGSSLRETKITLIRREETAQDVSECANVTEVLHAAANFAANISRKRLMTEKCCLIVEVIFREQWGKLSRHWVPLRMLFHSKRKAE